jgi:hypothetical protein
LASSPPASTSWSRAAALIAAGLAEAEALGMARETVRLQRLRAAALLNSRAAES